MDGENDRGSIPKRSAIACPCRSAPCYRLGSSVDRWMRGECAMLVVAALLAINAAVHALLVSRFGAEPHFPFSAFGLIDATLAIALLFRIPYAVSATLVLSAIALVWLTVRFNKPKRDKHLDREIWITNLGIVLFSGYLLLTD